MAYKFNPVTGKWDKVPDTPVGGGGVVSPLPPIIPPPPKLGVSSKDKSVDTDTSSIKEFIQVEYNILKGSVDIIPKLTYKPRKSINMQGFGNYLSGLYYVENVTTVFSMSGVNQTLDVLKNGFGETAKSREYTPLVQLVDDDGKVITTFSKPTTVTNLIPSSNAVIVGSTVATSKEVTPNTPTRKTHILKSGDTLWGLAVLYYKNGNLWRNIATANNISEAESVRLSIGRVVIIP